MLFDTQLSETQPAPRSGLLYTSGCLLPVAAMVLALGLDENLRRHHLYGVHYREVMSELLVFGGWPIALLVLLSRVPQRYKLTALLYLLGCLIGVAVTVTVG